MLGGRPREDLMADYIADHQNPINKRMHMFGIQSVFIAVLLWLLAPYFAGLWVAALVFSVIGVGLQLLGHQFEGKPPSASAWVGCSLRNCSRPTARPRARVCGRGRPRPKP